VAELRYFIARRWNGELHCSIENGDLSDRYAKEFRQSIEYRCAIRDDLLTLDQMTAAYLSGWRAKPEPKPVIVEARTRNSVKARKERASGTAQT
jgi:hypothetical protein